MTPERTTRTPGAARARGQAPAGQAALRAIIAQLADGIVVVDAGGVIRTEMDPPSPLPGPL